MFSKTSLQFGFQKAYPGNKCVNQIFINPVVKEISVNALCLMIVEIKVVLQVDSEEKIIIRYIQ